MGFLDNTGLAELWNKIKTYMSNNYAAKSHSHTPQNTFQTVSVGGSTNITADNSSDCLTLVAGDGISLAGDEERQSVTIANTYKYTHPSYTAKSSGLYKVTVNSLGHVSAATAVTKSDITGLGIPASDTTYSDFEGATTTPISGGVSGLVPAPSSAKTQQVLCSNGKWVDLGISYCEEDYTSASVSLQVNSSSVGKATLPVATSSTMGLMSAADKSNLDQLVTNQGNDIVGNAGTATTLQTARAIDGVNFNGSVAISHYATCSTAAATAAKTCTISNFSLVTGARVFVRFSYANTAASPTLNVSSTGAKAIYYKNAAIPANYITQYTVLEMVYSGSYWYVVGDLTKYLVDTLVSPTSLYSSTTGIYAAADKTWKYTTVSNLSNWKEVRMWVQMSEAWRGYMTFTRNDNTCYANGFYSASYYAVMEIICDFDNNRVGVYVLSRSNWTYDVMCIKRIEGIVRN
jgi:hypothetical protein